MLAYAGTLTKYSAAVLASVAAVTRSVGGKSRIWGIADRAVPIRSIFCFTLAGVGRCLRVWT